MTFDNDPNRPSTRRMDPIDPQTGYDAQPPAGPPAGSGSGSGRGRTALLAILALVALVVVAGAAYLLLRGDGSDDAAVAPVTATTSETTESSAPTTTTSSETSGTTTSTTTSVPQSGSVTYRFTGDGDLVGIRYRTSAGETVVAAASSPWSAKAELGSRGPVLSAVVVRGTVTCKILYDGKEIDSATSSGGQLSCRG
ncbi:MAG: hypothetical protein QM658_00345 [Gordonia sp. (in: high G+C Gram-positive bacteria)]